MCCGSRRLTLRPLLPPGTRTPPPPAATLHTGALPATGAPTISSLVALRYLQTAPIRVVGPATRRIYAFSRSRPLQMVDARDAQILGRSALFRVDAREEG